jgi:HEAT repeat protein
LDHSEHVRFILACGQQRSRKWKLRYTESIEDKNRDRAFRILGQMEEEFEKKNSEFFDKILLEEPALVVRVHAVTVLAEIGNENSVLVLGDVMKHDPSSLIRHECAFSLGQMGLKSAVPFLIDAALNDASEIVRHESAAALGAIGEEKARPALVQATQDQSEEVRGSAIASLFNLDFLKYAAKLNTEIDPETLVSSIKEKKRTSGQKKMPHP